MSNRLLMAVTLVVTLLLTSRVSAAEGAPNDTSDRAKNEEAVRGARFRLGVFGLAHAQRADPFSQIGSTGFVPGVAPAVTWRLGAWELGGQVRFGYYDAHPSYGQEAAFATVGGRARWFTAPEASLTAYLELGLDLSAMMFDRFDGAGASARVGGGAEVFHDRAHHRLSVDLGADFPTYRVERSPIVMMASGSTSWFSTSEKIYAVPVSVAAHWTF